MPFVYMGLKNRIWLIGHIIFSLVTNTIYSICKNSLNYVTVTFSLNQAMPFDASRLSLFAYTDNLSLEHLYKISPYMSGSHRLNAPNIPKYVKAKS